MKDEQVVSIAFIQETKNELAKIMLESYDKGVRDAKSVFVNAFRKSVYYAILAEREECAKLCDKYAKLNQESEALFHQCSNEIRTRDQDERTH